MDGTCEHSDVCGRDALNGHDGKCVLHSEDTDKDEQAFEEALKEHQEEHGPDFRQMVFPTKADFSSIHFDDSVDFEKATFEDYVSFREAIFEAPANFSDTTFKDEAHFFRVSFEDQVNLQNTTFIERADFLSAHFESGVRFGNATFVYSANFRGSAFGERANFRNASFRGESEFLHAANFRGASFKQSASFLSATFCGKAIFSNATFEGRTIFRDASFRSLVQFLEATFTDIAGFQEASFEDMSNFSNTSFKQSAKFQGASFKDRTFFVRAFEGKDEFQFAEARFDNCELGGEVLISGESETKPVFADGTASFIDLRLVGNATLKFRYADLSRCFFLRTNLQDVEFTGVEWCDDFLVDRWFTFDWFRGKEWFRRVGLYDEIYEHQKHHSLIDILWATVNRVGSPEEPHWTLFEVVEEGSEYSKEGRWSEVERLYRQLKRNYEERGDFPRAGDFHIGEKETRRLNSDTNLPVKALLWTYRALSKYGERAFPAFLWLVVLIFGFPLFYQGATTCAYCEPLSYSEAIIPSLEATFYPVRSVGFEEYWPQITSIVQRVISPVLIALLALALRQRVKR